MYNRWYDNYPELKSLLMLLENVDKEQIDLIAEDFLQIILNKYNNRFDEAIQNMQKNAPPRYNRWYDDNYNLHTCIEFIKTLNEEERKEIINSYLMSLLSFITNVDDE